MLRRAALLTLYLCLSLASSVHAEDDPSAWTAWLRYGRHMTLVSATGESLREVDLPLPEGYQLAGQGLAEVVVSRTGQWVVYRVQANGKPEEVVVYDLLNRTLVMQHAVAGMVVNMLFNRDETALAFSLTTDSLGWEIDVVSLRTGLVLDRLVPDDPIVHAEGLVDGHWLPRLGDFQDTSVSFCLEWIGNEIRNRAFRWNFTTRQLTESLAYPSSFKDSFSKTGEVLSLLVDNRFPVSTPESSSVPDANTIQIYDPISHSRFPVGLATGAPHFVQNGERVLLLKDNFEGQTHQVGWTLRERGWEAVDSRELPENTPVLDLQDFPDGFLYVTGWLTTSDLGSGITPTMPTVIPALFAVNTRDNQLDAGQMIWHISIREFRERAQVDEPTLQIAWVHSDAPVGPFKPWAQLAEPVYEVPVVEPISVQPTLIPTPEPLYRVGMTVRVQTTGGEILNLREAPTRESVVIMYLFNKMVLTLLEGPTQAEGYIWWRVRTGDGIEGWAVDFNGELQTLMPILGS